MKEQKMNREKLPDRVASQAENQGKKKRQYKKSFPQCAKANALMFRSFKK